MINSDRSFLRDSGADFAFFSNLLERQAKGRDQLKLVLSKSALPGARNKRAGDGAGAFLCSRTCELARSSLRPWLRAGYCPEFLALLASVSDFPDLSVPVAAFFSLEAELVAEVSPRVSLTLPLIPLSVIGAPPLPMCAE